MARGPSPAHAPPAVTFECASGRGRHRPRPEDPVTLPRLRRADAAVTLPTNHQVVPSSPRHHERLRTLVALAAFAGLRLGWGRRPAGRRRGSAAPGPARTQAGAASPGRAGSVTGVARHDLRHSCARGMIAAGCDVVTVQRALGRPLLTDRGGPDGGHAAGELLAGVLLVLADRVPTDSPSQARDLRGSECLSREPSSCRTPASPRPAPSQTARCRLDASAGGRRA